MCIILDANMFGKFNKQDKDMESVWSWLYEEYGKIVYSNTEKFKREWLRGGMKHQMHVLNQAGKLKLVSAENVQEEADALEQTDVLRSNDWHIIALAKVAKVKVLVSADRRLGVDFRNLIGGEVYQTKADSELLTRDTCP